MTGIIGLGAMGRGMATTLLREFQDLLVFDVNPHHQERIVRTGARGAASSSEVAGQCDVILTSLPDTRTTISVLENDLLPNVKTGTVVVDTGTTIVRETRRVAALYKARGAALVDAPVSGGPVGTAKGQLFTFVGGDKDAVEKAWPTLKMLSRSRLTYCGPSGAGQITKGVNQLAMGLVNAALVEAVAYGAASGVDESILLEAVGGQGGFRGEFSRVASQIASGLGDPINYKYSEFGYFLDHAETVSFPAPIMNALASFLRPYPHDQIDNIHREHPSLWGALMGFKKPETQENSE